MKLFFTVGILFFYHAMVYAEVSISTHRLFLDLDQKSTEFRVKNPDAYGYQCDIDFSHYKFNKRGDFSVYEDETFIPENSAAKIIRFSPKRFTILPKATQKIRFNLRNKRDTVAQEYRSHVKVICKAIQDVNTQSLSGEFASVIIKPVLVYNIPLVVRPRKLTADVSIENINEGPNNTLLLDLKRSGERSVYGMLNIYDEENELVTSSRSFPIYHETTSKPLSINLPNFQGQILKVEFIEDEKKSGNLVTSNIYERKG
jgi:P pilus assembly chaperone PapD